MRQGRHSRRSDDWDTEPSRSAERATAIADEERDPSKRSPGRKDKDYCKPARGPHTPVLVVRQYGGKTPTCEWRASWSVRFQGWEPGWTCFHEEECADCGKWFRHLNGTDCPDWRPITPQEESAISAQAAEMTARREAWARRKPVVTGPQGYRRAKPAR